MRPQNRGHAHVRAGFGFVFAVVLMTLSFAAGAESSLVSVAHHASPPLSLDDADVTVHVFLAEDCTPCAEQRAHLERMIAEDVTLRVLTYDVVAVDANAHALDRVAAHLGVAAGVIPLTLYGARHWVGFDDQVGDEVRTAVLHAGLSPSDLATVEASLSRIFAHTAQPEPLHPNDDADRFILLLRSGASLLLIVLIVGIAALRIATARGPLYTR